MSRPRRKTSQPAAVARRYLEPGPILLVTSAWSDKRNIIAVGWHTIMAFSPALVGCIISSKTQSFDYVVRSRECVINLPTIDLLDAVVGIGTTTGSKIDKFERFELTAEAAEKVRAPLIRECYANFECRLYDDSLVRMYNLFVLEIVSAHVSVSPKHPRTLHYSGEGLFMIPGKIRRRRRAGLM